MFAALLFLTVFAGAGIVVPIAGIGKVPKTLEAEAAAGAVTVLMLNLAALACVAVVLHGSVAAHIAEAAVAGLWFSRAVAVPFRVGRVHTSPRTAGSAVFSSLENAAAFAALLYLCSLAV